MPLSVMPYEAPNLASRIAGRWGCLTGSWKKATPYLVFFLIDLKENSNMLKG